MSEAYQDKAYWFSKISDFRFCPAYYKARHIDKTLATESSLDTEFGTALHLALNDVLNGGDGEELFNMYWKSVSPDLTKYKFDHRCLEFNGQVFISRFKRLHAKHFKPFKMEERIFSKFDKHLFEGTPDFLGDYKDIPSVVDFKTASSKYAKEKIIVEEQLSTYAALALKELKYEPKQRVYVVFVKDFKDPSIQILKSELTSDDICSTIDNVTETIKEIEAKTSYVKNTSNCVRGSIVCPNFQRCWGKKPE